MPRPKQLKLPGVRPVNRQLEKHIQAGILHYLNTVPGCIALQIYNGAVYDQRQGRYRANNNKFRPKGIPDIMGSFNGRPIAIEVKTTSGRLSLEQVAMHAVLQSFGWHIAVCRSVSDAQEFLNVISAEYLELTQGESRRIDRPLDGEL